MGRTSSCKVPFVTLEKGSKDSTCMVKTGLAAQYANHLFARSVPNYLVPSRHGSVFLSDVTPDMED